MIRSLHNKLAWRFALIFFRKSWSDPVLLVRLLLTFSSGARYFYLFEHIKQLHPKTIMEIGVWRGVRAKQMIEVAARFHPTTEIQYFGFDLFEDIEDGQVRREFAKTPLAEKYIQDVLEKTGAIIKLFRGDTSKTLPQSIAHLPTVDFVFIDGGHSIASIENDWRYVQEVIGEGSVVIFDDYWNREDSGCKKVVDSISRRDFNVQILPLQDRVHKKDGILTINFARVTKNSHE